MLVNINRSVFFYYTGSLPSIEVRSNIFNRCTNRKEIVIKLYTSFKNRNFTLYLLENVSHALYFVISKDGNLKNLTLP